MVQESWHLMHMHTTFDHCAAHMHEHFEFFNSRHRCAGQSGRSAQRAAGAAGTLGGQSAWLAADRQGAGKEQPAERCSHRERAHECRLLPGSCRRGVRRFCTADKRPSTQAVSVLKFSLASKEASAFGLGHGQPDHVQVQAAIKAVLRAKFIRTAP